MGAPPGNTRRAIAFWIDVATLLERVQQVTDRAFGRPAFTEIRSQPMAGAGSCASKVNRDITAKWVMLPNWARIRNQLAIRFDGRFLG